MRGKRFSEEQIIAVLKDAEAERRRSPFAGGTASASRRSTDGRPATGARRSAISGGSGSSKMKIADSSAW